MGMTELYIYLRKWNRLITIQDLHNYYRLFTIRTRYDVNYNRPRFFNTGFVGNMM